MEASYVEYLKSDHPIEAIKPNTHATAVSSGDVSRERPAGEPSDTKHCQTGDQGKRNVSHGCINIAPAAAQWFYDNFGSGDPVIVKNSVGTYNQPDGAQDWQV